MAIGQKPSSQVVGRFVVAVIAAVAGVALLLLGHGDPGVYFILFGAFYLIYASVTYARERSD